jgi:hypothetical protein
VILAEEQGSGLHPFDRRDLSAEVGEISACMDEIGDERDAEAGQLSQLVVENIPTPEVSSGGFDGGQPPSGAPMRGAGLQH